MPARRSHSAPVYTSVPNFAAVSAAPGGEAKAAVLGGPLLRDGMEIVPGALNGVDLDRLALAKAAQSVLLVADGPGPLSIDPRIAK